jgi:hypothetical protein
MMGKHTQSTGSCLLALILLTVANLGFSQTRFHVSPGGDDANLGTVDSPFATLGRAQQAVRARIEARSGEDIVVILRGGTYYLAQGLTFGPQDSGSETFSVRYVAYPNEVPV